MADKIKVWNRCPYNYGVITANNIHMNIRAGSFAMLTEDDIALIQSIAAFNKKPFSTGQLVAEYPDGENIEDKLGIYKDEDNYMLDTEEIDRKLKSTVAAIRKWLLGIESPSMLSQIAMRAKELDLPVSKLKAIDERYPGTGILTD